MLKHFEKAPEEAESEGMGYANVCMCCMITNVVWDRGIGFVYVAPCGGWKFV